jgi:hypothetical protein
MAQVSHEVVSARALAKLLTDRSRRSTSHRIIDHGLDAFLLVVGTDPAIRNAIHFMKRSADRVERVVAR